MIEAITAYHKGAITFPIGNRTRQLKSILRWQYCTIVLAVSCYHLYVVVVMATDQDVVSVITVQTTRSPQVFVFILVDDTAINFHTGNSAIIPIRDKDFVSSCTDSDIGWIREQARPVLVKSQASFQVTLFVQDSHFSTIKVVKTGCIDFLTGDLNSPTLSCLAGWHGPPLVEEILVHTEAGSEPVGWR